MHIEIISETILANPKEPILGGALQETNIYTKINGDTIIFPLRFRIRNGKVTVL